MHFMGGLHAQSTPCSRCSAPGLCDRGTSGNLLLAQSAARRARHLVYDGYPAGSALPRRFTTGSRTCSARRETCRAVSVEEGCPSCVQSRSADRVTGHSTRLPRAWSSPPDGHEVRAAERPRRLSMSIEERPGATDRRGSGSRTPGARKKPHARTGRRPARIARKEHQRAGSAAIARRQDDRGQETPSPPLTRSSRESAGAGRRARRAMGR